SVFRRSEHDYLTLRLPEYFRRKCQAAARASLKMGTVPRAPPPILATFLPSPLYSGERGRGEGAKGRWRELTPSPQPLSPEYRGEGLSRTSARTQRSTLSIPGTPFFYRQPMATTLIWIAGVRLNPKRKRGKRVRLRTGSPFSPGDSSLL